MSTSMTEENHDQNTELVINSVENKSVADYKVHLFHVRLHKIILLITPLLLIFTYNNNI